MSILIHFPKDSSLSEFQAFLNQLKKQSFQDFYLDIPETWNLDNISSSLVTKLRNHEFIKLHYYPSLYERWDTDHLKACHELELLENLIYYPNIDYYDSGGNLLVQITQKKQIKKLHKHHIALPNFSATEIKTPSTKADEINLSAISSSIHFSPNLSTHKIGPEMSLEDHKNYSCYHYKVGRLFYYIQFDRGMAIYHFAQSVRFKQGPKRAWAFYIFSMFAPKFIISASRVIFA